MSGLPEGWAEVTLADVAADIVGGGTPSKSHATYFEGEIPFMTVKDMNVRFPNDTQDKITQEALANSSARLVPAGTIVVATRMGLGKAVRPVIDTAINQDLKAIFPSAAISTEYLHWKLLESAPYLLSLGTGTTVKGIRLEDLRGLPIPLPPLPEQKRIVAKVDGLTARTARARTDLARIPTLIARYKQRLLALAFSGKLTAGWRVRHELPHPKEVTLSDVAKGFAYGSSAKSEKTGDVPVLRMGNIQQGKLDWSDLVFTSDSAEIKKYTLSAGDVLFNRTNSPELVGKTALYRGERPAIYAGYLIRIQCGSKLLPEFLTYCLNGPAGREYCWSVKTDGVSQSNINAKKIAAFRFLLPSLEEQAEIVRQIDSAFAWLDRVASDHGAATKLLPKLDAAILAKAFRGELVPQDRNDEPASALLARIKSKQLEAPKRVRARSPDILPGLPPMLVAGSIFPRPAKESAMTKSRQDDDVMGKPYLANLLKAGHGASAQDLFKAADLPVADFYKQLAWEIANKHVRDDDEKLEAL